MSAILDRAEELQRMKETGERCLAVASDRKDEQSFMMWKHCVNQLESMLVSVHASSRR